jgi:hypothetical protein
MDPTSYLDRLRYSSLPTIEDNPYARYTQGLCGEFAQAIHFITHWQLALLRDDSFRTFIHALVLHPVDEQVVDVYGVQTRDVMLRRWNNEGWGACEIVPVPYGEVVPWVLWAPEVEAARRYIQKDRPELVAPVGVCVSP